MGITDRNIRSVRTQTNIKYRIQNTTYKYSYNYAANIFAVEVIIVSPLWS